MMLKYQISGSNEIIFFDVKNITWMEYKAGIIHFNNGNYVSVGTDIISKVWDIIHVAPTPESSGSMVLKEILSDLAS